MTIVELMVVLVIVAVIAVVAMPGLRSSTYGGGVPGFANTLDAVIGEARTRAAASRRWQRLVISADDVTYDEATTVGMAAPVAWQEIRVIRPAGSVIIAAGGTTTTLDPGADPALGAGLPLTITFSPDGSATAGTIYLQRTTSSLQAERMRVTVVRATAASYVYNDW